MKGYAVGVYSPDTLRRMTAEEVNAAIRDDLAENAWERQCKDPVAYQGKNLAQHLERMLCVCPKCSRLGTLASSGGVLSCSCGFSVKYNEFGYFEGGDLPFENLLLWDRWQTEKLYERAGAAGEEMIFGDDRMELREIFGHGKAGGAITGAIRLFRDRLEVCGMVFPLCDISGLAIHGAQSMDITAGKRHFELRSRAVRCMRKYLTVFQYLTNKLREGVNA